LLMDLDKSDIYLEDGKFIVDKDKYENRVTGITYVMAEMFVQWVSMHNKEYYSITFIDGNYNISMESFKINLVNEFCYNKYNSSYTQIDYYIGKSHNSNTEITIDRDASNYPTTNNYLSNKVSFRMMKLQEENK